jgi:DNA-binding beta-propeller fold protein YncE
LNALNGSVEREFEAKADRFNAPVAMGVDGEHLWVANLQGNSVSELNVATGEPIRVLKSKHEFTKPDGIVVADGRVFVANMASNSISELSASSGSLIRIIH